MHHPVIVDAIRSPIGSLRGNLSRIRPDDLAATLIKELTQRNEFDPQLIEEVYLGCVNQSGEDSRNVGRMAVLLANLPETTSGTTINKLCASGMEAVNQAARSIQVGNGDVFIAGGVESMSRAPLVMSKHELTFGGGNRTVYDSTLGARFENQRFVEMGFNDSMGQTAENLAEKHKFTREEQDAFALESHEKAIAAIDSGAFSAEIMPVMTHQRKGDPIEILHDEGPRRDTSLGKLSILPAVFRKGGSVTPGNSCSMNDGAAALLIMSEEKAKELGLKPMARIIGSASAGVNPRFMGIGPVPATNKVLKRTRLSLEDMALIELNEAFAIQALSVIKKLGIDRKKLNVNGGAVALGHPLGCSGARIITTLLYALKARGGRYGLATMCIGMGQGLATIVENLE